MNKVLPNEPEIIRGRKPKSQSHQNASKLPETSASINGRANIKRGIQGSMLKYAAIPPHTPAITLSSWLLYNLLVILVCADCEGRMIHRTIYTQNNAAMNNTKSIRMITGSIRK